MRTCWKGGRPKSWATKSWPQPFGGRSNEFAIDVSRLDRGRGSRISGNCRGPSRPGGRRPVARKGHQPQRVDFVGEDPRGNRRGGDAEARMEGDRRRAGVRRRHQAGDFVGIASMPKPSGGDGAIEVLVFPAALKGTGEGSYPWDLKPGSTMTNATVANAVKDIDGRTL